MNPKKELLWSLRVILKHELTPDSKAQALKNA